MSLINIIKVDRRYSFYGKNKPIDAGMAQGNHQTIH